MKDDRNKEEEKKNRIKGLADHIISLACDSIVINLRFLDTAAGTLQKEGRIGLGGASCDGMTLYYDPIWLLKHYEKEQNFAMRLYLHVLLHCIFYHSFQYEKLDSVLWDLAADLSVENTILELGVSGAALKKDDALKETIKTLSEKIQDGPFTAERIYHYLKNHPLSEEELDELHKQSYMDEHASWVVNREQVMGMEQFQRISERIKADLKSFSKGKTDSESMLANLGEATKERYDYRDILRRFTCVMEDVGVSDDEFDYIYYTYGLSLYENMPLIEPLEYREIKKVREFVIAIDTSASCKGSLVRAFLEQTYTILKESESFFDKVNVHILQCDSSVQSDVKITCQKDFDDFLASGKLKGFGSTDFRPVFDYVDEQIEKGEYENLKGLIYFTDGYGVYPERMPDYDTIFAFLGEDDKKPEVPVWAIQVVITQLEIELMEESASVERSLEKTEGE
ncbi:MAG: hypothetical protein J1E61_05115 [Lachnospiraceae bacterium]|nr:hypothetical protein [Lachnospiraceae bacterium]